MKKTLSSIILSILSLGFVSSAYAICPLCTIAVGVGVGLAQWLGIDDTITGLWLGGLIVSLILWTLVWLDSKNIKFFAKRTVVTLGYYLVIVAPLYPVGLIGHPLDKLWGIDKLLLGTIVGSIFFFLGASSYSYLKKHNNDKAYFPFQKVVMPIVPLIILSVIFYFIVR